MTNDSRHNINQIQRHATSFDKESQGKDHHALDTGATDHVAQNKGCFTTFFKIRPANIKLPNNSNVTVNFAGIVLFSEKLILFNVLYVSKFSFNLISVQTLIKDLNCNMIFSSRCCQIQDITTSQMIRQVNFNQGLYYLNGTLVVENTNFVLSIVLNYAKCDINIWHFRLGHPARRTIDHICKAFPYIQSKGSDVCDVCDLSKQHKLPFIKSDTIYDSCFDLIHLDIWGPITIPFIHGHKYFLIVVDDHSRHTWIFLITLNLKPENLFNIS